MKKYKKFLVLAVAAAVFWSFSACSHTSDAGNSQEGQNTFFFYNSITEKVEAANAYLSANGYPEDFIEATGSMTKIALHEAKATFEDGGETQIPAQLTETEADVWKGFSYQFTVSDASDEDTMFVKKYLTFNWSWNAERLIQTDDICIKFTPEFALQAAESVFEIHGTGKLENSYVPTDSTLTIPQSESGTFLYLTGTSIKQTVQDNAISIGFSIGSDNVCRNMFPSVTSEAMVSSDYIPYGEYSINPHDYRGSFSIVLTRRAATFDSQSTAANYKTTAENRSITAPDLACNFYG